MLSCAKIAASNPVGSFAAGVKVIVFAVDIVFAIFARTWEAGALVQAVGLADLQRLAMLEQASSNDVTWAPLASPKPLQLAVIIAPRFLQVAVYILYCACEASEPGGIDPCVGDVYGIELADGSG